MRFKDLGPVGSVVLGFEIELQGLEAIVVVDAVQKNVFFAGLAPTDKIHLVEIVQVGYWQGIGMFLKKDLSCQAKERLTISSFPVRSKLLDATSLLKSRIPSLGLFMRLEFAENLV